MLITCGRVAGHVQRLKGGDYFVRVFATPVGPIDPETGQPFKPYIFTLLIVVTGESAEVQGALVLPAYALPAVRKLGRALSLVSLWWQSWEWNKEEKRFVKLPKITLEL